MEIFFLARMHHDEQRAILQRQRYFFCLFLFVLTILFATTTTITSIVALNRKTAVLSVDAESHATSLPAIWGDGVHVAAFPPLAERLRLRLCEQFNCDFNVCLVNVYETGKNTIGWHADNEEKGDVNCIASLSLGSERRFSLLYRRSSRLFVHVNTRVNLVDLGKQ